MARFECRRVLAKAMLRAPQLYGRFPAGISSALATKSAFPDSRRLARIRISHRPRSHTWRFMVAATLPWRLLIIVNMPCWVRILPAPLLCQYRGILLSK